MSSFGGPGNRPITKPTPPQRGSFPLDHDGKYALFQVSSLPWDPHLSINLSKNSLGGVGECRHVMTSYLSCISKVGGENKPECRDLAKAYLGCRMDRNLMAKDDFKNLGFQGDPSQQPALHNKDGAKDGESGKPGELRW
ncbi:hypothetical protein jhhlp_001135 [Lomentospora prolificans]|uniref:CHCH domain-containing protein n=1 Tax=Lomentospora prolificans TaxID=41688 RepID=A0A2N3NHG8_9PEZI|nr:hypothetical protein jhhlp_001135 [Lomentospora prolificans]